MHQTLIEVHDDATTLAAAVAGELLARLTAAQARGEVPHIGLTGGSIADAVHHELGRLGPRSDVDWSQVVVWWGDERYVAADSPDRNAGQARPAFLDRVPLDPAHVHEMPATDSGRSLEDAAAAYDDEVRAHGAGAFDVLMLGLGPDGHVASLMPGQPALDVDDRIAVAVHDSPKPPPERISLTYPALNRSRSIWFLVSGESKADAVAAAQTDGDRHEIPARGITGVEEQDGGGTEITWFLDRPAASRL